MSTTISQLAHTLRPLLRGHGYDIKLGHTQQLLAAALGYQSLAAQQATNEPSTLDASMYWVVDQPQLAERARTLELDVSSPAFVRSLATASRHRGGPKICGSTSELHEIFVTLVQDHPADDESVGNSMAETNCTGPFSAYLEAASNVNEALPSPGEDMTLDYEGSVEGEQDTDRPFSGDSVDVKAQIRLSVLGKRLLGQPEVEIIDAALDWSWSEKGDDTDDEPSYTKLQALAIELNLSSEEAVFVEGAEITQLTTSSGTPTSYLVDLTNCPSSVVVDQLVRSHGTHEIRVWGSSFEYIRLNPWD